MPATLPCDLCHQENAVLIAGEVETGQQMTVGAQCLPMWHLARAEEAIGFEAIASMVAARIAAMAPPPEEKPAPRRRGKRPTPQTLDEAVEQAIEDQVAEPEAAPSDG